MNEKEALTTLEELELLVNESKDYINGLVSKVAKLAADAISEIQAKEVISCKQTATSSEDGGKNIFTLTFVDGSTADITVKNGSKGSSGVQGETGPAGPQGPKGDTGAMGPQGPTGATGAAGKDGLTTKVSIGGAEYAHSNGTITVPNAAVQKAVTPTAPTSGQVAVFDGTSGQLKSSGFTIATSVPSGAKFTDTNTAKASSTASIGSASKWSTGTLPTLGTAIAADDITAWSAGTAASASVSKGVLTITNGTAPSLSYTARSIPNVTAVGSLPSLTVTNTTVVTGVST